MKIGVDSCIIIAGVHANHPLHVLASDWLIRNISLHELIVTHHTILETYAVLTRLPGELKTNGPEATKLLETSVRPNMKIVEFNSSSIWECIDSIVNQSAMGGRSYDAFIAEILINAGAEAIATFNTIHFTELSLPVSLIDPSKPA